MKKIVEKLWFQPYTPIFFFFLIIFLSYKFAYPAFQNLIREQYTSETVQPSPTPILASDTSIIEAISKLVRLPSDEKPQVISITNVEQFKDQPFFKNAKNGDILVLYEKNKKAILFDPKANIVVDTAPIAIETESREAPTPTASPSIPTPKSTRKEPTPTPNL